MKNRKHKINFYSYVFKDKKVVFFGLLVLLVSVLLGRVVTYLNTYIVDKVIANQNFEMLITIGLVILGLLVIEASLYFLQNRIFCSLGYRVAAEIRRDLYDKIVYAPIEYYETHPVANILSKTTTYINDIGNFFIKNFVPFLLNSIKFLSVFFFMLAINPIMGLIMVGVLALLLIVVIILNKISHKKNLVFKKAEIGRDETIVDSVYGHQTLLANGERQSQLEKFEEVNNEYNKAWQSFSCVNELFLPLLEGLWFLGIVLVYFFAFGFISSGFELGAVITFITYITQTNEPIKQTALNYQMFINIRGTIERVFDIMHIDISHAKKRTAVIKTDVPNIVFKDVSCDHKFKGTIIQNLSFEIAFREKILLKGVGGSGKSTIAYLMSRLYSPSIGKVVVGDKNIETIKNESFRQNVGILTGEVSLFNESLFDNVKIAKMDASDEDVMRAVELAGLSKKIATLPRGVRTFLRNNGEVLSEGEKQLVGFARLILQNPKIVIIDEIDNSFDKKTKAQFYKTIKSFCDNKTLILISVKDSPYLKIDRVIELIDGKIV